MRKLLRLLALLIWFSLLSMIAVGDINAREKLATIDPFTVDGMTVISPLNSDKQYAYATNFEARTTIDSFEHKKLIFKAIRLYRPDFSVFIREHEVWKPEIEGYKEFLESPAIKVKKEYIKDGKIEVKLVVRGYHGGMQLFEIYR